MLHVVMLKSHCVVLCCVVCCICVVDKFGDDLEIEVIRDPGTTGNFEVRDVATGDLLHSKRNGGDRCESEASKSALADKIAALMK